MRIALSGAPGTGKTTLGNLLGKYTSLEYFEETEDKIIEEIGYKNIQDLIQHKGVPGLIDNFFLSVERKMQEEREKDNYVTDKSMIDMGARWFGRLWKEATPEQHDQVRAAMNAFAGTKVYDKVIYLPLYLARSVEDDGRRTTETELRYQRSLIIQGLNVQYDMRAQPYEFLFSDPPEKVISDLDLNDFRKR